MVAQVGRYYGAPIKGSRGFTKGDPISPTIFNMVVCALICHWVIVSAGEELGPEGFVRALQTLDALFYADDRILASPRLARIQEALDLLMRLFDLVRLRMNVGNTAGMNCQPCCTDGRQ